MSASKSKKTKAQTVSPKVMDLHSSLFEDIKEGSKRTGQCFTVAFLADRYGVSTTTVYNHLRQFYRDGVAIFKTARGLVIGSDTTLIDQIKTELKMACRTMGTVIEANAVCPVIITSWGKSNNPNKTTVIETAKSLTGNSNEWTRNVHNLYSIIDEDNESKR